MATLGYKKFELINVNTDYIEFVVSYTLGSDYWVVDGIGWMSETTPKYYLRLLRMNGKPASHLLYNKARIVLQNSSYIFNDKELDAVTLSDIENIFLKTPKSQPTDLSIETIELQPRQPFKSSSGNR